MSYINIERITKCNKVILSTANLILKRIIHLCTTVPNILLKIYNHFSATKNFRKCFKYNISLMYIQWHQWRRFYSLLRKKITTNKFGNIKRKLRISNSNDTSNFFQTKQFERKTIFLKIIIFSIYILAAQTNRIF